MKILWKLFFYWSGLEVIVYSSSIVAVVMFIVDMIYTYEYIL